MLDILNPDNSLLTFIKTRCIGITGSIASGKSYIGSILKELGFFYIDADSLAKKAYLKESKEYFYIIEVLKKYRFNQNIDNKEKELIDRLIQESNDNSSYKIDTKILVELFMIDRSLFKEVEKIVHSYVENNFYKIVKDIKIKQQEAENEKENEYKSKFFFYESALLVETGWVNKMFKNILLTCPLDLRLERMNQRGYPSKKVFDFLSEYQLSDEIKKQYCDIVIDSSVDKKELRKDLINILKDNSIILL